MSIVFCPASGQTENNLNNRAEDELKMLFHSVSLLESNSVEDNEYYGELLYEQIEMHPEMFIRLLSQTSNNTKRVVFKLLSEPVNDRIDALQIFKIISKNATFLKTRFFVLLSLFIASERNKQ